MSYNGIINAGGGKAWGNIFQVNTPYLDQMGKQIFTEEQNRQLRQQKENERLDHEFSKSVANIRDTDVNEYVDKYQTWKQAKIGLMKMNPHKQKDYIAAQMDANKKLADLSAFGNTSISAKAQLQDIGKRIAMDKNGDYKDDAYDNLIIANQTPTSRFSTLSHTEDGVPLPFNPLNLDEYKYKGNTVKWQPLIQKATGIQTTKATTTPTPTSDNLGTQTTDIKAVNSPLDYYTQLTGSLVGSGAQRSLNATYKFSDDEAQQIVDQYNEKILNNPIAKQAWGEQGLKLPTNALLTPATRTVALLSMQHALTHPPEETKPTVIPNRGAIMDKAAEIANRKMYSQHKLTQDNIRLAAGLRKDAKNDGIVEDADAVLHNVYDIFHEGEKAITENGGKPITNLAQAKLAQSGQFTISDPNLLKTFSNIVKDGSTPIPPNNIVVDKSKDQVILNYNMSDGTTKSIPMSGRDMIKIKVKETYPNKDIGQINKIIDKVISKGGGLYKTIQMYNPAVNAGNDDVIKIKVNGKILQGRKADLLKLDNAKVKYEIVE